MKKIPASFIAVYSVALLSFAILASCSYRDGYYYLSGDSSNPGTTYGDSPRPTNQGKIAFNYNHLALESICLMMQDIIMFNDYYNASDQERVMMADTYYYGAKIFYDENDGTWNFSRADERKKFRVTMSGGLGIEGAGGQWLVSYRRRSNTYYSCPEGADLECVVEYAGENRVRLQIPGYYMVSNDFYGKCDLEMEYGSPEASLRNYGFVISGQGGLKSIRQSWFMMDFSIPAGFSASHNYVRDNEPKYYMEGGFDIKVTNTREDYARDVHAKVNGKKSVVITYEGYSEEWLFRWYAPY